MRFLIDTLIWVGITATGVFLGLEWKDQSENFWDWAKKKRDQVKAEAKKALDDKGAA
jgi:hypothetical protein